MIIPNVIFLSLLLLQSCSYRQGVDETVSIVIVNRSAQLIDKVRIKQCGSQGAGFQEMVKGIKPGMVISIPLAPGCFDAEALTQNGDIMATQYNVNIPPKLRWNIH